MDTEREIYIALGQMKKRYDICLYVVAAILLVVIYLQVRQVWKA